MLIGALLGAAHGASHIPEKLKQGLLARVSIAREIKQFIKAIQRTPAESKRRDEQGVQRSPSLDKEKSVPNSGTADVVQKPAETVRGCPSLETPCVVPALPHDDDSAARQPPATNFPILMSQCIASH